MESSGLGKIKSSFLILILTLITHNAIGQGLSFQENKGQWHEDVFFRSRLGNGLFYIEKNGLTYSIWDADKLHQIHHGKIEPSPTKYHVIKQHLINAQFDSLTGHGKIKPYFNYFKGKDTSRWASDVRAYKRLKYYNVWEGIDWEIIAGDGLIKTNYYLNKQANIEDLRFVYKGADQIDLKPNKLIIHHSLGEIEEVIPKAYAYFNGNMREIQCVFKQDGDALGFEITDSELAYDSILIDPEIIFATYSGSEADNFGYTATPGDKGMAYSGGTVFEQGFPTEEGNFTAFDEDFNGGVQVDAEIGDVARDIGILKYSADGTDLIYATYLGGEHNEDPHSMIMDKNNNLVVFGNTKSEKFPTTLNAFQDSLAGDYDIYISKLSSDGKQLLSSTYFGGSGRDGLNGSQINSSGSIVNTSNLGFNFGDIYRGEVMVDSANRIIVHSSARSSDLPVINAASSESKLNGEQDAIFLIAENDLSSFDYAGFFGSKGDDAGYGVKYNDSLNCLYLTGGTSNNDTLDYDSTFLNRFNGYQKKFLGGKADGFILKFNLQNYSIEKATLLGTSRYDQTYLIEIGQDGTVYVAGQTINDSSQFPVKNTGYYDSTGGNFITRFDSNLDSILNSLTFGSANFNPDFSPSAILVDNCDRVYFSGWGGPSNSYGGNIPLLPTTPDAFQVSGDGSYFYIIVFEKNFDSVVFATHFGGNLSSDHVDGGTSRFDENGIIYQSICASCGSRQDLPTSPNNVWSSVNEGKRPNSTAIGCNNALLKMDLYSGIIEPGFTAPDKVCITGNSDTIQFTNKTTFATDYLWRFGNGDTSTEVNPEYIYTTFDTGRLKVTLITKNRQSCQKIDSVSKFIDVGLEVNADYLLNLDTCTRTISATALDDSNGVYMWDFGDGNSSLQYEPIHQYNDSGRYEVDLLVDGGRCKDSLSESFQVIDPVARVSINHESCSPFLFLDANSKSVFTEKWLVEDSAFRTAPDTFEIDTTGIYNIKYILNEYSVCADTVDSSMMINSFVDARFTEQIDSCRESVLVESTSRGETNYQWYLNEDFVSNNIKENFNLSEGINRIRLIVSNPDCIDTLDKEIEIKEKPEGDFSSFKDTCTGRITFYADTINAGHFHWYFGNGDEIRNKDTVIYEFKEAGDFEVMLVTAPFNECSDTARSIVSIDRKDLNELFFPNIFTPNGDGKNDNYIIQYQNLCITYLFEVFNRWGERVYRSDEGRVKWDGRDGLGNVRPGTYYFRYVSDEGKENVGTITIAR